MGEKVKLREGNLKILDYYGPSKKYVYYNDLQEYNPTLYQSKINSKIFLTETHSSKMESIAQKCFEWANYESQKEAAALSNFFGVNIQPSNNYTVEYGRKIIDAINATLSFKSTYERYVTRIIGADGTKGTAKITGAQLFVYTFESTLIKLFEENIKKNKNLDLNSAKASDILASGINIDDTIEEALNLTFFEVMKESGDWDQKDTNQGYKELFETINNFSKLRNEFIDQVKKLYNIDEFKQILHSTLINNSGTSLSTLKKNRKLRISESTLQKGTLAEYLGGVATQAVAQALGKDVKVTQLGAARNKPDYLISLGIDASPYINAVNKTYANREEAIKAITDLNNRLASAKDGYLIYTNAKDYTLNSSFEKNGFSAGSPQTLKNFEGVIQRTPGGSAEIIASIMSTMEGAIYSDIKDQIEEVLVQKMAYFLFDDVHTIGEQSKASSHVIHLMLLDGIYMPMSYMFFLLGRAIQNASSSEGIRQIFDVKIEPGKVKYKPPYQPPDYNSHEAWNIQRKIAYDQITIQAHFLKNFKEIIREVKGR